jgi:hypothetical protein
VNSIIEFIYTDSINNYKIIGNFKIPYFCLREEIHVYNPMEESYSIEVEYKLFEYGNWIFYKNDSLLIKVIMNNLLKLNYITLNNILQYTFSIKCFTGLNICARTICL